MVISEALMSAAKALSNVTPSPSLESKILLEKVLGCDRLYLIKNRDESIDAEALRAYEELLRLRLTGKPISYITGHKEFMGLDFLVNEHVLIPRPDTETLAEYAISLGKKKILDIGTGSGALAVSLAKYIKASKVYAIDIKEEACKTALCNAERNGVTIHCSRLDILSEDIKDTFELIVSNPPYIKDSVIPTLEKDVKDFEPIIALSGGKDGLKFYRAITKKAHGALSKGGVLAFEIGYDQGKPVSEIMSDFFSDIKIIKDLSGHDRVVSGVKTD